uniref:Uncharacterized protein n=1 Tax=Parastrongyloides trichosuri TaxID=131310 RepID=A0A0N5A170_PARTI
MIHPINIPEELFASNPRRPKLLMTTGLDKPRKKLSYTNDGRKMVNDIIKSPLSPNSIWRETFLRTFIRRLSVSKFAKPTDDKNRDDVSRHSIPTETCDMIDIIDLEPKVPYHETDKNNVTTVILEDDDIIKNCCSVNYEAICPILQDCCDKIIDSNGDRKYQEFMCCDFSNFNSYTDAEEKRNCQQGRKNSINFIPTSIGNRIWLEKEPLDSFDSELRFNVQQVNKFTDSIAIDIHVENGNDFDIYFKTLLHAHVYKGTSNNRAAVAENTHILLKHAETQIKIWITINDLIKEALEDDDKSLKLTLMAKLETTG